MDKFGTGMFRLEGDGLAKLLGPLEAELMESVWASKQAVTAREVQKASETRTQYVTVVTVLNNLARKGVLRRDRRGRILVFEPVKSREDFLSSVSEKVVRGLVDLSPRIAVNSFLGILDDLPEEILDQLRSELASRLRQADDGGKDDPQ